MNLESGKADWWFELTPRTHYPESWIHEASQTPCSMRLAVYFRISGL